MIPVARVAEPPTFDERVRRRGNAWAAEHPGAVEMRPYWTEFLTALREGFAGRCGYSAMFVPEGNGTVDHHLSQRAHPALVYEWSNLRFASTLMNTSKRARVVLDPYEVGEGWFEVLLPSMELVARWDVIPASSHDLVRKTFEALPLVHDERIVRQRFEWYAMHRDGELSMEGLRRVAPLIAGAVERWRLERPGAPLP